MVVLNANVDTNVVIEVTEFDFYLFVFNKEGCDPIYEVFTPNGDCIIEVFTMNVDYPMGIYDVSIYGQDNYSNLNPDYAEWIRDIQIRVYNPEDIDWLNGELTDEFNYPLQDEKGNILYG